MMYNRKGYTSSFHLVKEVDNGAMTYRTFESPYYKITKVIGKNGELARVNVSTKDFDLHLEAGIRVAMIDVDTDNDGNFLGLKVSTCAIGSVTPDELQTVIKGYELAIKEIDEMWKVIREM